MQLWDFIGSDNDARLFAAAVPTLHVRLIHFVRMSDTIVSTQLPVVGAFVLTNVSNSMDSS